MQPAIKHSLLPMSILLSSFGFVRVVDEECFRRKDCARKGSSDDHQVAFMRNGDGETMTPQFIRLVALTLALDFGCVQCMKFVMVLLRLLLMNPPARSSYVASYRSHQLKRQMRPPLLHSCIRRQSPTLCEQIFDLDHFTLTVLTLKN